MKKPRIMKAAPSPPLRGGRDPDAPSSPAAGCGSPKTRNCRESVRWAAAGGALALRGIQLQSLPSAHARQPILSPLYFLQPLKFLENIFAIFPRGQLTDFLPLP